MKTRKGEPRYTPEEKENVKREIINTIAKICTGDAATCKFGDCIFTKECAKPFITIETLPRKTMLLAGMRKNVQGKLNRKLGKKNPHYLPELLRDKLIHFLGQDIREHPLVKGHPKTMMRINSCTTINQVVEILERRKKITELVKEV